MGYIYFQGNVMGIHYDYKSTRGMKAMEKAAKRERRLAERKAKREAKEGKKKMIILISQMYRTPSH